MGKFIMIYIIVYYIITGNYITVIGPHEHNGPV